MNDNIHNTNIYKSTVIKSPYELEKLLPISEKADKNILRSRNTIKNIISGEDKRLMVIVGPCSIHDIKAAKEYALKLKELSEKVAKSLYIVMRVYFEKPRTTVGWKGLLSDPNIDNSLDVNKGLYLGRELLQWLAELDIATATEVLNPITPQYIGDLVSWCAIGARTTESQTHREMASGLSMAVGFKNGTEGNLDKAINAIKSCKSAQSFLGVNEHGQIATFAAKGNKYCHIILRGGNNKPNYSQSCVTACEDTLEKYDLPARIMIDCSHDNSNKDYRLQAEVLQSIAKQIKDGNKSIFGVMLESNLFAGKQPILENIEDMKYGVSITDGCIDWQETAEIIEQLSKQIT